MNSTAKILIPNKEWLVTENKKKIGSISKEKKGYSFHRNGDCINFKNLNEVQAQLNITFFEESIKKIKDLSPKSYSIYDYPCKTKPFNPMYDLRKRLPIYISNPRSKSQHCAGYYLIHRKRGWVPSFCPKSIILDRYPFYGPFKTKDQMAEHLQNTNKNETT